MSDLNQTKNYYNNGSLMINNVGLSTINRLKNINEQAREICLFTYNDHILKNTCLQSLIKWGNMNEQREVCEGIQMFQITLFLRFRYFEKSLVLKKYGSENVVLMNKKTIIILSKFQSFSSRKIPKLKIKKITLLEKCY